MVTVLLADTDPKLNGTITEVENICHAIGLGLFFHHPGDDLDEILDLAESPVVAFSPDGHMTLDAMISKYGGDVMIIIGGFTEDKDFESDVYKRAKDVVSLGPDFLTIPKVIEKILEGYEKAAKGRRSFS